MSRSDEFRQKAQCLRELAASTRDQCAAAALAKLATSYEYLARREALELVQAVEIPVGAD